MSRMFYDRTIPALLVAVGLALGCAARIENVPLERYEQGAGYGSTFRTIPHQKKLRVVLAFSGGGTRAAALSYGVLKEIRDTKVVLDGVERRLLDQVSTISSVSGGSFTAAYYGLNGEQIFEDFEEKFLRQDFDTKLGLSLLRPIYLFRILFTPYTRSDMASDLYDRKVFKGATFEDLDEAAGPVLDINSTDIDIGAVFTFKQSSFNEICSDLSKLRVAKAVTASSAVPGLFTPLVLRNHAGTCDYGEPEWMQEAFENRDVNRRRYRQARVTATYLDSKERPYIFLLDGGVADNIGARRLLADVIDAGSVDKFAGRVQIDVPEHVLYIIVNAQAAGYHQWRTQPRLPRLRDVLSAISGTGIYRYNFETVELLRESTIRWARQAAKDGQVMTPHVAEVAFDSLSDPEERKYFNSVKTSFKLDDETIDRLIEVGGRLLRESSDFKEFLAEFK